MNSWFAWLHAFAVVCLWMLSAASPAKTLVGFSPVKMLTQASSVGDSVPLANVLGALVDDVGDLILFGERCDFCSHDPGRLLLMTAAAAQSEGGASVITTSSIAPGSKDTRLVYSAAVAGTELAKSLAGSIQRLNEIADGNLPLPVAFKKLPVEDRPNLVLSADLQECVQAKHYKIVLLTGRPIRLSERDSNERAATSEQQEWMRQTESRFNELVSLYPELGELKHFLKLLALYRVIGDAGKDHNRGLLGYRAKDVYQPAQISYDFDRNIIAEIAGGVGGDYHGCKQLDQLRQLRAEIIEASHAPSAMKGYFDFDADLWDLSPQYRNSSLISRSKEVGAYTNTIWLDASFSSSPQRLKVIFENHSFHLPKEATGLFLKLVRRTGQMGREVDKSWAVFRERHLNPLLGFGGQSRDRLVIVLSMPTMELPNLSRMHSLRDLQVIVVSRSKMSFEDTILVILDRIAALNRIVSDEVAYVVNLRDVEDAERVRSVLRLIDDDQLLVDARRVDLKRLLGKRGVKLIVFDVGMDGKSLQLGNDRVAVRDLLYMGRFDHVAAVIFGAFGLHKNYFDSEIVRVMQGRGIGMVAYVDSVVGSTPRETRIETLVPRSLDAEQSDIAAFDFIEKLLGYKPVLFEYLD